MGNLNGGSSKHKHSSSDTHVDFTCFTVLRSIGRGSYGKVCIAQKTDSKELYAMKYMNKKDCIKGGVVSNIIEELKLLRRIQHDHIVNLRFAFHDFEDMCLVVDLLQGGDLRYHLNKSHRFSEHDVSIYLMEIASALEYLHSHWIVHRDVKPDNILMCLQGHVYLTDFNVATRLDTEDGLLVSQTGTWSYMAPEIFATGAGLLTGYSYSVDWWSLGVTCYELCHGHGPFSDMPKTGEGMLTMFNLTSYYRVLSKLSPKFCSVIKKMLAIDMDNRLMSHSEISSRLNLHSADTDSDPLTPQYLPSQEMLNADPTYELEELIMESKPIHKKRSRLSKSASKECPLQEKWKETLTLIEEQFKPFNYLVRESSNDSTSSTSPSELDDSHLKGYPSVPTDTLKDE